MAIAFSLLIHNSSVNGAALPPCTAGWGTAQCGIPQPAVRAASAAPFTEQFLFFNRFGKPLNSLNEITSKQQHSNVLFLIAQWNTAAHMLFLVVQWNTTAEENPAGNRGLVLVFWLGVLRGSENAFQKSV